MKKGPAKYHGRMKRSSRLPQAISVRAFIAIHGTRADQSSRRENSNLQSHRPHQLNAIARCDSSVTQGEIEGELTRCKALLKMNIPDSVREQVLDFR
jgi:hypothetical protein